jgi:hypothetical protein
MKILGKDELLKILYELQNNCGDIRGRDGEYLDQQVEVAIKIVEEIRVDDEE